MYDTGLLVFLMSRLLVCYCICRSMRDGLAECVLRNVESRFDVL